MLNKRFLHKVSRFIALHGLMEHGRKYLVALSGGADSVALTLALKELGYDIEAAHCNFRLRGSESERDENFCKDFCNDNGISLHLAHFDTATYAALHKVSIEMAARNLRYDYFGRLAADIGAAATCVAHHQDDSVETVLLNLIRGTGVDGLTGIKPRNGSIVRPLLCVMRGEIEAALTEAGQPYVTDSTNLVDDVVRNKIRLDILPLMKTINPSASQSISATARRVSEAAAALDAMAAKAAAEAVSRRGCATLINIPTLMAQPAPGYALFKLLKGYAFTPTQIEQLRQAMQAGTGRTFTSPTHTLLVDRDSLVIEPNAGAAPRPLVIPECGTYLYGEHAKFRIAKTLRDQNFKIPTGDKRRCMADASAVAFPLTVRPAAPGDRFTPFGMNGTKLVSDYLTDAKLNLFDKRRQPIVTDARGRIVWLVGLRTDNRFRITDRTTEILEITYTADEDA